LVFGEDDGCPNDNLVPTLPGEGKVSIDVPSKTENKRLHLEQAMPITISVANSLGFLAEEPVTPTLVVFIASSTPTAFARVVSPWDRST
jgi:hypothetical protein